MKKHSRTIFVLIVICLFTICSNRLIAQQSKVDSAIMLFNKSIGSDKPDTASFNKALQLLRQASLNDSQIDQIDAVASNYKHSDTNYTAIDIREAILRSITKSNPDKAITYGKLQIERIDKIHSPEASNARKSYLNNLRYPFRNSNQLEEGFQYYTQKLNEYKTRNDSACIASCYNVLGSFYGVSGLLDLAIYNIKKSTSYIDSVKDKNTWLTAIAFIGYHYSLKGDKSGCIKYSGMAHRERGKDFYSAMNMARVMLLNNQLDSADFYLRLVKHDLDGTQISPVVFQIEALYNIESGALGTADSLLKKCWQLINKDSIPVNSTIGTVAPDYYLALLRIKQNRFDEAISLLQSDIKRLSNKRIDILRDYKLMAELYKKTGRNDKAAEAYSSFIARQDSLMADQDKYRSLSFEAEQQMNEKEQSIAKLESQNEIATLSRNFLIGIAALLVLVAAGLYNRFRYKKKANLVLENTLTNLKSTQSQLIQSEKMASLGELTAGIAHEIQNPLNFVNNFSEVNTELLVEMKDEMDKGNLEDAKSIANDVIENEQKINHHGKRADAIVKGMLQHSSRGSGKKEPTDINKLADEYLRLAYHGLRAKDKSFNATMITDYDESIDNINIVPQDIGRVILNLINNAFYVVNEKQKLGLAGYEPTVTVKTLKPPLGGLGVLISVSDNGGGIPQKILDKIFQPFFTTKPTGQGTGLGLSLSYDIVKAHGGELSVRTPLEKVETKEGEGAEFIIQLPLI